MGVTAGIFLASILHTRVFTRVKEMRYLVYIRYLWLPHAYQVPGAVEHGVMGNYSAPSIPLQK
jgi:hypothetical protein